MFSLLCGLLVSYRERNAFDGSAPLGVLVHSRVFESAEPTPTCGRPSTAATEKQPSHRRPCPAVLLPIPDLASIDDEDNEDELSSLMSSSFARRRRVKRYPIINTHTVRATTLHSVPPALLCAKKIRLR